MAWLRVWGLARTVGRPPGSPDRVERAAPTPSHHVVRQRAAVQFGRTLRQMREARNIAAEELGNRIGKDGRTVLAWERGAHLPSTPTIVRLAVALGTTVTALLEEVE